MRGRPEFTDIRAAMEEARWLADTTKHRQCLVYIPSRMTIQVRNTYSARKCPYKVMARVDPVRETATKYRCIRFKDDKYWVAVRLHGKVYKGGAHNTIEQALEARKKTIERACTDGDKSE